MWSQQWFSWFAWRPVRLIDGRLVWWRTVERRSCEDVAGEYAEYRDPRHVPLRSVYEDLTGRPWPSKEIK